MTTSEGALSESAWFRELLDSSDEVYFRYGLSPQRGFVYLSPSVHALTGQTRDAFYENPALCFGLIAREDRRVLHQVLRARRALDLRLRIVRAGTALPVDLKTVAVVRNRKVVAVEGVVRLARADGHGSETRDSKLSFEPTTQRLAALMYEVHDLLHRVLPSRDGSAFVDPRNVIRLGELAFDLDRLSASEGGKPVPLTSRELMVLRHLVLRTGRIVTREQLLTDVWGYTYTGDDRTVDVHISRLRRKLPSLASRLVAVKHVGYRLDTNEDRVA